MHLQCPPGDSSTLNCTWQAPALTDHYSILDYELTYKLADGFDYYPGYGDILGMTVFSSAVQQYILTGLQPYGGYFIKLRARVMRVYGLSGSGSGRDADIGFGSGMDVGSGLRLDTSGMDLVNSGLELDDTTSGSGGRFGSGGSRGMINPDDDIMNGDITHINITSPEGTRLLCIYMSYFSCYLLPSCPSVCNAPVTGVVSEVVSATSARLSWLPPHRQNWNGRIESYLITATRLAPQASRKRRAASPSAVTTIPVPPQANHPDPSLASEPLQQETFLMEELEEYFEYSFEISVQNAAGNGVSSIPITQEMPESGLPLTQ